MYYNNLHRYTEWSFLVMFSLRLEFSYFLARLHFSAEELLLNPSVSVSVSASASACKMLGQMLKSWNFSLSVKFNFAYHKNKAPHNISLHQESIR